MNKLEKAGIKLRILRLARMRSTGTPAEMARRFEISERSVKRIIKELKESGEPLHFDFNYVSYVSREER